jgi:hypothetical protein
MTTSQGELRRALRLALAIAAGSALLILGALSVSGLARGYGSLDEGAPTDADDRKRCSNMQDGGVFEYKELESKSGLTQQCKCDQRGCCECF